MNWWLLLFFLNIIVILGFVFYRSVHRNGFQMEFSTFFSASFLLYWILPFGVGKLGWFVTQPSMPQWYNHYNALTDTVLFYYYLVVLITYSAFALGIILGEKRFRKVQREVISISSNRVSWILIVLGIAYSIVVIYYLRENLFKGYSHDKVLSNWMGQIYSLAVAFLSIGIIFTLSNLKQTKQTKQSFFQAIRNLPIKWHIFLLILILSMGGRQFIVSTALILLILWSEVKQRISYKTFLLVCGVLFFFIMLTPIIRVKGFYEVLFKTVPELSRQVVFNKVAFIGFSELFYISFPQLDFLQKPWAFEWIHFPKALFSQFANLIPSMIYPQKQELMITFGQMGYKLYNPAGAMHSYVPHIINFGIIGSVLINFLYGFGLTYFRYHRIIEMRAVYILSAGWLSLALFRDFDIALIKMTFQFSILLPVLLIGTSFFVKKNRKSVADKSVPNETY